MRRQLWWLGALIVAQTSIAHAQVAPIPDSPSPTPPPVTTEDAPIAPPGEPTGEAVDPAVAPPAEQPVTDVPVVEEAVDPALLGAAEGADAQLSEEELKALGFGSEQTEPAVDTSLRFFGFADFNVLYLPMKKSSAWRSTVGRHASMALGNVNLFFSKSFTQNVRTLGEVRFHFAPHGSEDAAGNYIENVATDPASFNRPFHWGGIEIERLYLEWQLHTNLAVRSGMYLTPYGIWNVDHGSPIIIPVQRPYVIGESLFPERQTGFEFLGSWAATDYGTLGYHVTFSNGTGPVAEIIDLDDNKAVGGRLYWDYRRLGSFRLGGSIYYGRETRAAITRTFDPATQRLILGERVDQQSDLLSLAADVQWRYRGLHLQAEVITQQRRYTDRGRKGVQNPLLGRALFPEDAISWGTYGLVGYRFDWFGVMPYLLVSSFDSPGANSIELHTNGIQFGLNVQPIDGVVAKLEYALALWPDGFIVSDDNLHMIQAQLAWAF